MVCQPNDTKLCQPIVYRQNERVIAELTKQCFGEMWNVSWPNNKVATELTKYCVGQISVGQMKNSWLIWPVCRQNVCWPNDGVIAILAKCLSAKCLSAKCLSAKCLLAKCLRLCWVCHTLCRPNVCCPINRILSELTKQWVGQMSVGQMVLEEKTWDLLDCSISNWRSLQGG